MTSLIDVDYIGGVQTGPTVTWSFASAATAGFSDPITDQTERQMVVDAFATWSAATGLDFVAQSDGATSDVVVGFDDNQSACSLGLTMVTVNDGTIDTGARILLEDPNETALYAGARGPTYGGSGIDDSNTSFSQLSLHEIGHVLGMGESGDVTSIMDRVLDAQNETLDANDYANAAILYGGASAAAGASSDGGTDDGGGDRAEEPVTLTAASLTNGAILAQSTASAPRFIYGGSDAVAVTASAANAAITTGAGDDRITVTLGQNSLSGGAGSNMLVGGSGTDTFSSILTTANAWTTIAHFNAGDTMVLWGFLPGVSTATWQGVAGAAGLQGETLMIDSGFHTAEALTFTGSTSTSGFAMAEGTTASGIPYLIVGKT